MSVAISIRTANPLAPGATGGEPLIEKHPKTIHLFFQVTLSNGATNYSAGGEVLDLTQLFNSVGLAGYCFPSNCLPEKVELQSIKPASSPQTNLYEYSYAGGTAINNGKIQVFTGAAAQTALTELANGNYPAGVTSDIIEGEAIFPVL